YWFMGLCFLLVLRRFGESPSGEVEKQCLGWFACDERKRAGLFDAGTVAGFQRNAVERERAVSDLQPRAAALLQFVRHTLARLEANTINIRVLMYRCRTVASIR